LHFCRGFPGPKVIGSGNGGSSENAWATKEKVTLLVAELVVRRRGRLGSKETRRFRGHSLEFNHTGGKLASTTKILEWDGYAA